MSNSRIVLGLSVLMGLCLLMAVDNAAAKCGKQCKEAKNYCSQWEQSNPGETCGTARGLVCMTKSWKKIKQVNVGWVACRLTKGEEQLEQASARCAEHEKYWGKGECEVHSPRCKAGWVKIEKHDKFSACRKLQPSGRALYDIYQAFMRKWEGKGQKPMHPALKDFLKRHYTFDADRIRWGEVTNPHATCTTDCENIYCKGSSLIKQVSDGQVSSDIVFHELEHVEQCKQKGGRKNYARMWFGDLPVGFFSALKPGIKDEFKDKVHDRMPMEKQAEQKAQKVMAEYQKEWWHKSAKCRIFKADKRTLVHTSENAHPRVYCDSKYGGPGWDALQKEAKRLAQTQGDGTYVFAFGRPDLGQGVWLGSSVIKTPKPRTTTKTRASTKRPAVRKQ